MYFMRFSRLNAELVLLIWAADGWAASGLVWAILDTEIKRLLLIFLKIITLQLTWKLKGAKLWVSTSFEGRQVFVPQHLILRSFLRFKIVNRVVLMTAAWLLFQNIVQELTCLIELVKRTLESSKPRKIKTKIDRTQNINIANYSLKRWIKAAFKMNYGRKTPSTYRSNHSVHSHATTGR